MYFLESVGIDPPRIKIGYTKRKPSKRLLEVEYAAGVEMRLLGFIWGSVKSGDSEWDLHKRFARWKLKRRHRSGPSGDYLGEFFSVEIRNTIVSIIQTGRREQRTGNGCLSLKAASNPERIDA